MQNRLDLCPGGAENSCIHVFSHLLIQRVFTEHPIYTKDSTLKSFKQETGACFLPWGEKKVPVWKLRGLQMAHVKDDPKMTSGSSWEIRGICNGMRDLPTDRHRGLAEALDFLYKTHW